MYDVDGNPYVGDIEKSLLKRNVPVGDEAVEAFEKLKTGALQTPAPQNLEQARNAALAEIPDKLKNEALELFNNNASMRRDGKNFM